MAYAGMDAGRLCSLCMKAVWAGVKVDYAAPMARHPTIWPDEDPPAEEADLWFLPGPPEDAAPDPWPLPQAPVADCAAPWLRAQGEQAVALARVAARLGALDARLRHAPAGWRHRLALLEAAELSWHSGDRVPPDRLAQWLGLRLAGVQADAAALARVGWAVRRLAGGPAPELDSAAGLVAFLGRHDPSVGAGGRSAADPLLGRAEAWLDTLRTARGLHPITRAAMGYRLWPLAALGQPGDRLEPAVSAARLAVDGLAEDGRGALFAPLAMGGGRALRAGGSAAEALAAWLAGMEAATLAALRALDQVAAWSARASAEVAPLSGRTPPALVAVLAEWPLVSAPTAQTLTGASRAAIQRNLAWMQARGLIVELTGQSRFRMWRAALGPAR